jgi:hypothetical protein
MTSRGAYMQCKYCDKETVFNTSVCNQHGGIGLDMGQRHQILKMAQEQKKLWKVENGYKH